MRFDKFIFKKYTFDEESGRFEMHYSFDDYLNFIEIMNFQIEDKNYDKSVLNKALFGLFIMAGVSYYKSHQVNEIEILDNQLSEEDAKFFSRTYQNGLGEYYYINNLDPNTEIVFPFVDEAEKFNLNINEPKILIGLGGGKDSLVSVELFKNTRLDITTWSLNHKKQLEDLINKTELKHYQVSREIDNRLIEENDKGALNGHIPISAILSFAGVVQAILSGRSDVVVSNEQTANEPNLEYMGRSINHQYSKSSAYEADFQKYLKENFGEGLRYYSILRPLSELKIAEIFADNYLDKYLGSFSSCNRAFKLSSEKISWCGECPKCAFVYLAFSPFVEKNKLVQLFEGKDLFEDPELDKTYRELLGIEGIKPLECVGEIKESRSAMMLAEIKYPELKKYIYQVPENYDYNSLGRDLIPQDIKKYFLDFMNYL